jgi:hypothetical protein
MNGSSDLPENRISGINHDDVPEVQKARVNRLNHLTFCAGGALE